MVSVFISPHPISLIFCSLFPCLSVPLPHPRLLILYLSASGLSVLFLRFSYFNSPTPHPPTHPHLLAAIS